MSRAATAPGSIIGRHVPLSTRRYCVPVLGLRRIPLLPPRERAVRVVSLALPKPSGPQKTTSNRPSRTQVRCFESNYSHRMQDGCGGHVLKRTSAWRTPGVRTREIRAPKVPLSSDL